ncbi:hypothetical protein HHI36_021889 [Cryptolaemus montrouzieri]|uniref:Uncharacterized protein n=1 Tax=Cryptolaemus montrouzieri TaxID=559131 RepID=A0ABD2MY32_9CUCU
MLQLISYLIAGFSFWICSLGTSNSDSKEVELLLYKNGEVLKENFVYFSVQDEGNIRLTLNSDLGDADLYIAQHSRVPTYEPDTYDLHSASCGEDVINVPKSFKRPIVIGIYGNTGYEVTKYQLRVEVLPKNMLENSTDSYGLEENEVHNQKPDEGAKRNENLPKMNKPNQRIKNNKQDIKSGITSLLEIIAMVL